jgi:hypothetical protein
MTQLFSKHPLCSIKCISNRDKKYSKMLEKLLLFNSGKWRATHKQEEKMHPLRQVYALRFMSRCELFICAIIFKVINSFIRCLASFGVEKSD